MLTDTVHESNIPVEPILGETKMLLSEIANLQVGDVIALDSNHDEPISVKVGGKPRFRAKPGRKGEQSSVQLVSVMHN